MSLINTWTNSSTAEDDHPDEHNRLSDRVVNLEQLVLESPNTGTPLAGGGTAPILQTIYGHGTGPAASVITIDSTRQTVAVEDNATPTGLALFRVGPSGAPLLQASVGAVVVGDAAATTVTLEGIIAAARVPTTNSVELGATAGLSSATDRVDIGNAAGSQANDGVAVGPAATNTDAGGVAVGHTANTQGGNAVAVGNAAATNGASAIALGDTASAQAANAVAIGSSSSATGSGTTAVGAGASASGANAQAFGNAAQADTDNSLAVGTTAVVTGASDDTVVIGNLAVANNAAGAVGLGNNMVLSGDDAVAVGNGAQAGTGGIGIGASSDAGPGPATQSNIAIGYNAEAKDAGSGAAIAIGPQTVVQAADSVSIGNSVSTLVASTFTLGRNTQEVLCPGTLQVDGAATIDGGLTVSGGAGLTVNNPVGVLAPDFFALVLIENSTLSDADSARSAAFAGLGTTSGGTRHATGGVDFQHDGSGADQRGKVVVRTNSGAQGLAPGTAAVFDADRNLTVNNDVLAVGEIETATGTGAAMRTDTSGLTADRTVTLPDADRHLGDFLAHAMLSANVAASTVVQGIISRGNDWVCPWDGEVIYMQAVADGTPSSGHTCTAQVKVNGSTITGGSVSITNADPNPGKALTESVSAGDTIGAQFTGGGTWATRDVALQVFVRLRVHA